MNKRRKTLIIVISGIIFIAIFLIILLPIANRSILEYRLHGDWIILNSSFKKEGTISFFSDGTADFGGMDGALTKYKAVDSSHIRVTHSVKNVSTYVYAVTFGGDNVRLFGNDTWYILQKIP